MAKSQNNNSVKSSKVDLVKLSSNSTPKAFSKDTAVKEQVVNARKASSQNKEKAKKKAKMAKKSRKKAR
ncbi:hypothetical protein AMRN_1155 [Malaciobacter marinus]|jgi:hypothetical protein|uniref:Uncharacterized protein n=2 Tax=Malaciobacter TaxID=2321114 RepID=A0A347TJX4_9BACT|nr:MULTISPECIES: hypothetical protein [Malaciobacter]AXX86902.1 hypothetical protein AMRN_1155 [Malaciobacter marinus]PHO10198.1 hypothetical protein CPG37_05875 [Malaciobacter canalis]PHO11813.1 hypothetical protein CPG38_11130 [Malaciobacter marinus]PHO15858.1 hypothetical protein CPH92_04610 [Malaciobacter marinus]PPK59873.1 hypothetical protein B0F89_13029 [Malaciobacter marinus]